MSKKSRNDQDAAKKAAARRKEELLAEVRAQHPELSEAQLQAEYGLLEAMGLD